MNREANFSSQVPQGLYCPREASLGKEESSFLGPLVCLGLSVPGEGVQFTWPGRTWEGSLWKRG